VAINSRIAASCAKLFRWHVLHIRTSRGETFPKAVNNNRLAALGFAHGVDDLVVRNPSNPGSISHKTMADTIEALVGAAFRDSNGSLDAARTVADAFGIID